MPFFKKRISSDESNDDGTSDSFSTKTRKRCELFDSDLEDDSDNEEELGAKYPGKGRKKSHFLNSDSNFSDDDDEPKVKRRCGIIDTDDAESDDGSDESSSSEEEEDVNDEKEEDENLCPICLGNFEDQMVGIPENCKHIFCVECLTEWSKNVNNCPVDRKKFNLITIKDKYGEVIDEVVIKDAKKEENEYEDPPTYCQVCGECNREDCMLLCDECDHGYHMDCLSPPLECVPIDEWFCINCAPPKRGGAGTSRRRGRESDSEFIGDETVLNDLHSRVKSRRREREHLMFGQSSSRTKQARTVASNRHNQRGRSASTRGRSSGGTSSSRRKRKRKASKSSKGRKRKKSKSKAKKKIIKDELEKVREKLKQESECIVPERISLFGNPLSLDDFCDPGNDEELIETPVRSAIVDTPDVVGSILGGFEKLNPDKVVVCRDGSLKEKSSCSVDTKQSHIKNPSVKKRKIRFVVESDSSDEDCRSRKEKEDICQSNEEKTQELEKREKISEVIMVQEREEEKEEYKNALLDKMRKRLQATRQKKAMEEEVKQECQLMKASSENLNYKTNASIMTVASFKIPKLRKKEKNAVDSNRSDSIKEEQCCQSTSLKEFHDQKESQKEVLLKTRKPLRFFKETSSENGIGKSERKRPPLTKLEKKVKLYNEGKLKGIQQSTTHGRSKPTKATINDIPSSNLPNKQNVSSDISSSMQKKAMLKSQRPNFSKPDISSDSKKKSISLSDYRNRRLFEEVFGDADLEVSEKEETQMSPPVCNPNKKTRPFVLVDPKLYKPAKGKASEVAGSSTNLNGRIDITTVATGLHKSISKSSNTYANTSSNVNQHNMSTPTSRSYKPISTCTITCEDTSSNISLLNMSTPTSRSYKPISTCAITCGDTSSNISRHNISTPSSRSYKPISTCTSTCGDTSSNVSRLSISTPSSRSYKPISTCTSTCGDTSSKVSANRNISTLSSHSCVSVSTCSDTCIREIQKISNDFEEKCFNKECKNKNDNHISNNTVISGVGNASKSDSNKGSFRIISKSSNVSNSIKGKCAKENDKTLDVWTEFTKSIDTSLLNPKIATSTKCFTKLLESSSNLQHAKKRLDMNQPDESSTEPKCKFYENSPYSVFRPFPQCSSSITPVAIVSPSPRDLTVKACVNMSTSKKNIHSDVNIPEESSVSHIISGDSSKLISDKNVSSSEIKKGAEVKKSSSISHKMPGLQKQGTPNREYHVKHRIKDESNLKDGRKAVVSHDADFILKIKDVLKPYYKSGLISKEQWKAVVKMSVKMIQSNLSYFSSDDRISVLVQKQLKPFLLTVPSIDM